MASGGKRGASDRVLESKHVIGLFLLMLLFSGVFFTLGYVMGRNQYGGQVNAEGNTFVKSVSEPSAKSLSSSKNAREEQAEQPPSRESDPATSASSGIWDLGKPANTKPQLEEPRAPVVAAPPTPTIGKALTQPVPVPVSAKAGRGTANAPLIPSGAYVLQVAALLKQDDALSIASGLQKKHFAAYVQTPVKDKYYRVQVGPFKDQKTADVAKKGLEGEGFKAFYVKH